MNHDDIYDLYCEEFDREVGSQNTEEDQLENINAQYFDVEPPYRPYGERF